MPFGKLVVAPQLHSCTAEDLSHHPHEDPAAGYFHGGHCDYSALEPDGCGGGDYGAGVANGHLSLNVANQTKNPNALPVLLDGVPRKSYDDFDYDAGYVLRRCSPLQNLWAVAAAGDFYDANDGPYSGDRCLSYCCCFLRRRKTKKLESF